MIIRLKDGTGFQTKSGSNIIFRKSEYIIEYLSITGVICSVAVKDIKQIEQS